MTVVGGFATFDALPNGPAISLRPTGARWIFHRPIAPWEASMLASRSSLATSTRRAFTLIKPPTEIAGDTGGKRWFSLDNGK